MPSSELESLRQQLRDLEQRNAELETRLARRDGVDEDLYRFLFDTMDEGFCVIEFFDGPHGPLSDYTHVTANAAYTRHAGIPDVIGQTLREMVPAEADDWIARYGAVLETGEPLQFEQELIATGRVLSVTSFRIEPAARHQVAVLFQDVTERRRAEKALQRLNEQLEQRVAEALSERRLFAHLVDNSVARVQVVDSQLRCLAINQQARMDFESLFARTPEVGELLPDILSQHPEDCSQVLPFWHRALSGEAFMEVADFGSINCRRSYELHFNPLRDAEGRIVGAYLFAYDISDRVQEQQRLLLAEEALRQAQKMELLGQLTGGIAHDFNNLLAAILGAQELMRLRLRQQRFDALPPLVDIAGTSARRAASLVQRLLAFARRQTLQPQPTHVGELLDTLDELVRRSVGASIELQTHCAPDLWLTCIDAAQLESALLNLCFNARDAMPTGGRIRIDCENTDLDHQQATALDLRAGEYLHLSVTDNGLGMPPQVAERAIDPFFTTKPMGQGSGLGLSMAYGFMRQSGGQLQIDSMPEQGTCIHLYLPRHLAPMD
ncbi:PAS domain-containing protein [Pseudomonas capeferrum]|uniref:hybrid sensor histidine kinase/response regulator n=1 Tax=Pseudomonas capeferrum TaxID=1495066 RepID=UPI0015E47718|nr:PAS domain-containing protein [Pseudomonas capeferrum]